MPPRSPFSGFSYQLLSGLRVLKVCEAEKGYSGGVCVCVCVTFRGNWYKAALLLIPALPATVYMFSCASAMQRWGKSCGYSLGGTLLGRKAEHWSGASVIPNSDCWWIHPDFGHIPPVNTNGNVTHECWRILPIIFGLRAQSWDSRRKMAICCVLQAAIHYIQCMVAVIYLTEL